MANVYFNYGVMGSAKTAQAIMNAYQHEECGYAVLTLIPKIGCRDLDNANMIESRTGMKRTAYTIEDHTQFMHYLDHTNYNVVIIDEAQFLTSEMVEDLFYLSTRFDIPVYCYGLMTDYTTNLFEGSKRLIELGAKLNLIHSVSIDGTAPVINAKLVDGKLTVTGNGDDVVDVGREELYKAITLKEYFKIKGGRLHC